VDAGLLGGGLVGGLLGRALGAAVRGVAGQFADSQRAVEEVRAQAVGMVEGSARVRAALGGSATCLPPVSTSAASSTINGLASRRVTLLLPVCGRGGRRAQATVTFNEGAGAGRAGLDVRVALPGGEVVRLGGGGGGEGLDEGVIDVEYHSID
jgi:hypothetical protein